MYANFAYLFTIASMFSVVLGEKCGYVRAPFASTNDTVVINIDCSQSTPLSHHVPLQLRDDVTHLAVQLVHCQTVPVGLFANVTDNLTSVTVASEDAVELFGGTFEGLEQATELRMLGFTMLSNLSNSVFEPLRNIQTLILDGFGSVNIQLPDLGSVIQKLSGTPIRRLVLNKIKHLTVYQSVMKVDNFRIFNASVKELIITGGQLNYEGSISQAFPDLVCFCARRARAQTYTSLPAIWDLMLLSNQLEEVTIYTQENLPAVQNISRPFLSGKQFLQFFTATRLYPDLIRYFRNRLKEAEDQDCELRLTIKFGAKLSKITARGYSIWIKTEKPICFQEDNHLIYIDLTGTAFPGTVPVFIGFKKVEYLNLENTGIRNLPNTFLQYLPSLKVLKLSKDDLGDFIENIDGDFFGSSPTLTDIYLDGCNIKNIPMTIFSRLVNLLHLDVSKNDLHIFDFDVQNCTRLNILNFSRNNIGSITQRRITELTRLPLRRPGSNNLVVDLSYNRLHCLCNSTHFIKWLQRSPVDTNINFQDLDSYTCLYPNGSTLRVSEVIVSELEQQCSVIQTLVNGSDCPCDEEQRSRLQQVWVHLDGLVCRNNEGVLAAMTVRPLPSCFNPYSRASFIAPVVVGGILGITVLITVSLLIYFRKTRRVRQIRECLEMNPVSFVRWALQYVMTHNREEEQTMFRHDMIIFVADDDRSSIHNHFIEGLRTRTNRGFITRDDFAGGADLTEAMIESIRICQWIVPVLTGNFISNRVCVDFVSKVQLDRPHALIPIVWEQLLEVTEVSVAELLRTGDPLYWPGDLADPDDKRNFWSSLLDRATTL